VFEAVSHGTTNPWGLDWNELGEPFFINTVIGHLWHAVPGAHFNRMHGDDVNAHSYGLIEQHADHFHFDTGAGWTKSRAAQDGSAFAAGSDTLGGGHAHCGLMIYLGANWPDALRGRLFTLNFHGRRINQERLEREGSGYVGRHERDLLTVADPWFRGLELLYGPDGGVFIADWSDTGECHDQDGVHRSSGRIYKVTAGTPQLVRTEGLLTLSNRDLVALLFDRNEWLGRQARQVLADRVRSEAEAGPIQAALRDTFERQTTAFGKLRALWGLIATGGPSTDWLLERSKDPEESVRSWAVRVLVDSWPTDDPAGRPTQVAAQVKQAAAPDSARIGQRLVELAGTDSSALVRLYLASALQRLSFPDRGRVAAALVRHGEDAADHNLPLMLWYGVEPLVGAQPEVAIRLAVESQIPLVRELIARRLAEEIETRPEPLSRLLHEIASAPAATQAEVLQGMRSALRGWRKAPMPAGWATLVANPAATADGRVRDQIRELGVVFGEGRALDELRAVVANPQAGALARRQALQTLVDNRADTLGPLLRQAADDNTLRTAALLGLLQMGHSEAPGLAASRYLWVGLEERPALVGAMVTRLPSAKALLAAIASGAIPRADLTPFHARQIVSLHDAGLTARLGEVWGVVRPMGADKAPVKQRFRQALTPERLPTAELGRGRVVFQQVCANCHRLYGEGGAVGPDLTGSGRANLDYLLDHIIDPSALVPADYRMAIVTLKDGRVLNGVVRAKTVRTVSVQTQTELTIVEWTEITALDQPEQSLMPEGLLESLPPEQARDLLAYLLHPQQVPLPAKP